MTITTSWPAGWAEVEAAVMARATPTSLRSTLHGPRHWRAVARVGIEVARGTQGADQAVLVLFALLHDSQRLNDDHDPDHGRRAAALAAELARAGRLDLAPERLDRLRLACAGHADGGTSTDPTIGTCWDADRLNLWRVGITPARRLLSTSAARAARLYDWSQEVHEKDRSWAEIAGADGGELENRG